MKAAGLIDQLAYDDEIDRLVEDVMGKPMRVVDDVTKRDSGVRTLARFAVESGRPVVERA